MKWQAKFFRPLALFFILNGTTHAENINWYIESDPIAYMLDGYSLHGGLETNGFRMQIGTFAATVPEGMRNNASFITKMNGFGVKIDYFGQTPDGWFTGAELGNTDFNYQHKNQNMPIERKAYLAGIRTGYKFTFENAFYITPWIALKRNLSDTSPILVNGDSYQENRWLVFPTIHLGMQF